MGHAAQGILDPFQFFKPLKKILRGQILNLASKAAGEILRSIAATLERRRDFWIIVRGKKIAQIPTDSFSAARCHGHFYKSFPKWKGKGIFQQLRVASSTSLVIWCCKRRNRGRILSREEN